jgi:hypothetical protein
MRTLQVAFESHIYLQDSQLGVLHPKPTVVPDAQVKGVQSCTSQSSAF